jgi:hypothetical protein
MNPCFPLSVTDDLPVPKIDFKRIMLYMRHGKEGLQQYKSLDREFVF